MKRVCAQSYGLSYLFYTVSTIVNRAQMINCYGFKIVSIQIRDIETYVWLSFCTLCQPQPILIPPTTGESTLTETARGTGIRTRA